MDFLTTAQLLMKMQEIYGRPFHYRFEETGILHIELVPDEGVAQMFEDAHRLFEPA